MTRRRSTGLGYGRTVEFNALPRLGERPGVVLFPWCRVLIAGLGFVIVAGAFAAELF